MHCENAQPWLGAWQDGEVSQWRRWQIARHVEHCAQCQAEVVALAQLDARLQTADPVAGYPLTPAPLIYRFGTLRFGMVAAAVLLLALTGIYSYRWQTGSGKATTSNPVAVQQHPTATGKMIVDAAGSKTAVRVAQHVASTAPAAKRTDAAKVSGSRRSRRYRLAVRPRKPRAVLLVATATKTPDVEPREVIEISVKIADPQQVVQEYQQNAAEVERIAANNQECIYVVATPEIIDAVRSAPSDTSSSNPQQSEKTP